jgi:hypothetical protein
MFARVGNSGRLVAFVVLIPSMSLVDGRAAMPKQGLDADKRA